MKDKNKQMWKKLLLEQEYPEKNIDKILDYIEIHSDYEVLSGRLEKSTLHLALKLFQELDLDNIEFIKKNDRVKTNVLTFNFDDILDVPDVEMEMSRIFVEETRKMFEKILETKKVYIFLVFSEIVVSDDIMVFNRFYLE